MNSINNCSVSHLVFKSELTSIEEVNAIFAVAHQIDATSHLISQEMAQLLKKAKNFIVNRPQHLVSCAAMQAGQALQTGLKATNLFLNQIRQIEKEDAMSCVFLLPEQEAVFKLADAVSNEEERIIQDLAQLELKQPIVAQRLFKTLNPAHFGIDYLHDEDRKRALSIRTLKGSYFHERLGNKESGIYQQLVTNSEWELDIKKILNDKETIIVPQFASDEEKQSYELCEKNQWTYICKDRQKEYQLQFRSLQKLLMKGFISVDRIHVKKGVEDLQQKQKLQKALTTATQVKWSIITSEMLIISKHEKVLKNVVVKPFIEDLILFSDLEKHKVILENIMKNFNEQAELKAMLTGELQFLDLHHNNLGLMPCKNEDYTKFQHLFFALDLSPDLHPFYHLHMMYLNGSLNDNLTISYVDPISKQSISGCLKDLLDLKKALNVDWEIILFDNDKVLGESNTIHQQERKNFIEYLIPYRSVLLKTEWRDRPLKQQTIDYLMHRSDETVEKWINRLDAPIWHRIKSCHHQTVLDKLKPFLEKHVYTFAHHKPTNSSITIKDIRQKFATDFATLDRNSSLDQYAFWFYLQSILLNKRTPCDLVSNRPIAMKQRYQIALQLFPRLTWRQRDALVERRKNCRAYLQSFATLQATTGDVQTLLAAMKAFANQPTTPISSHQRQLLNSQFNASTHLNLKQIQGLHQQMCSLCQPTYFNVMKAMYPYLADAYALNIYVCNEKYKAGELIGIYKYPLEEIMERFINAHHPSSHPGWISFNQLKTLIESEKNPAYFGSWRL